MSREDWRETPEALGYEVTSDGEVRRIKTGNILSPSMNNSGYMLVNVGPKGNRYSRSVHRMVARAFVDGYEEGLDVNHINGDKLDNRAENLEWCSRSDNIRHAFEAGLAHGHKGPNAGTPPVRVRIIETDDIYPSISECARAINGSAGAICMCLKGKYNKHHGYHFEMVSDEQYD